MIKALSAVYLVSVIFAGCGGKTDDLNIQRTEQSDAKKAGKNKKWLVRASANLSLSGGTGRLQLSRSSFSRVLKSDVAESVIFSVDDSGLTQPPQPWEDLTSFGKIIIRKLRDNNLRVCGEQGSEKCSQALIRIYTVHPGGDGYWNSEEQYGIPIKRGEDILRSGEENALHLGQADLRGRRVLKLSHFGSSTSDIPVSIDFSDAARGKYSAEFRLEYVLR